jgi:hypothetical protein
MQAMTWEAIVGIAVVVGLLALGFIKPWRFWFARRHCHQCKTSLPRWNVWGWRDDWTCSNCGCQISR